MFEHLEQSVPVWEKSSEIIIHGSKGRPRPRFGYLLGQMQSGTGQSTKWGKNIWCKVNQLKCSV